MKVLFVIPGRTHYFNLVLSKLHAKKNWSVVVVVPSNPHLLGEGVHETYEGVNFPLIEAKELVTKGGYFFESFWKILLKVKPDIIVTTKPYLRGFRYNLATWLLCYLFNIKIILKDHPFNQPTYSQRKIALTEQSESNLIRNKYNLLLLWLEKIFFLMPDAIICYIKDGYDVFGSWGVSRKKIFITGNSPDTDLIAKVRKKLLRNGPKLRKIGNTIIHTGRLVKWKKVDLLIKAVAQLQPKYPDIRLLIVGYGPEEQKLKSLTKKLDITESVTFLGGVYGYEHLGPILMSSSLYVLAGMGGISINDAMAFGLPVIVSRGDGTEKTLVRDGYNGYYFKENNLKSLTETIDKMLSDRKKLARMGSKSLQIISNEVNIHTVLERYIQAFKFVGKTK